MLSPFLVTEPLTSHDGCLLGAWLTCLPVHRKDHDRYPTMRERISDPLESQPTGPTPKKRGRPPGSVSLTDEIEATIVGLIRRGAMPHVAAVAAGISPRTLNEWIERGEGRHPTRLATPRLRSFAREVRIARGLTRLDAETRVFRNTPKVWLRTAARSRPGQPGWTVLGPDQAAADAGDQLVELIERLDSKDQDDKDLAMPRRGRPPGSVALTPQIQATIARYLRAGAFLGTAAEAAGISARTIFDWLERAEGRHPSRPATAKLRAFAGEIRRAQAEARAVAETRVHDQDPQYWLRHAAPTVGDYEGWSSSISE